MTVPRPLACSAFALLLLIPAAASGQSVNGAITGVVKDSSGGVVADVALTLRNIATDQTIATTVSGASGEYAFRNLPPAQVRGRGRSRPGFQQVTRPDIDVTLSSVQRVDIELPIGAQETARRGGRRLLDPERHGHPGARHLAGNPQPASAADEQRPAGGRVVCHADARRQHGRRQQRLRRAHQRRPAVGRRGVARWRQHAAGLHEPGRDGLDLPGLPDVARHGERGQGADLELRAGVRVVDLRADHGRHQVRRQLVSRRGLRVPPRRHAEGQAVGRGRRSRRSSATTTAPTSAARPSCRASGPTAVKSYFYFNYEGYRQTGGSNQPTLSIPSSQERNGDFSDWRDASGNLIPIYDPADPASRRPVGASPRISSWAATATRRT